MKSTVVGLGSPRSAVSAEAPYAHSTRSRRTGEQAWAAAPWAEETSKIYQVAGSSNGRNASRGRLTRLLAGHPKDAAWYPWAVPEWENDPGAVRVTCHDPALDEKLHLIFQLTIVRGRGYGPVRKMFQRACARLNARPWKGILRTTDDFIVIPFDPHGELDARVDLKASVPVDRLRLLMDRGYIRRMKLA